jgi:hypothetical protein
LKNLIIIHININNINNMSFIKLVIISIFYSIDSFKNEKTLYWFSIIEMNNKIILYPYDCNLNEILNNAFRN